MNIFNSKFNRDKIQGDYYEKEALRYLKYDTYKITQGYFKEYDIITYRKEGIVEKIEVKSDRLSSKTGNLCIEYQYKGCNSGINSTEADYYFYFVLYCKDNNIYGGNVIKYDLYKIPVNELKELVKDCKSVYGGDGGYSKMYLLPKYKCKDYLFITKKIK